MMNYPDHEVGHQKVFWVRNHTHQQIYRTRVYYQVNATALAVGNHCYVYVDNDTIETEGETELTINSEFLRDAFESTIYPNVTYLAGHPDGTRGDIDGDPHIFILFTPMDPWIGYYDLRNDGTGATSNECEMIYIDSNLDLEGCLVTLPHELHHLIFFNQDPGENSHFIYEGLAEYASFYTGYPEDRARSWMLNNFTQYPEDSLLFWNSYSEGNLSYSVDYGGAFFFMAYLVEQYGIGIMRNICTEPLNNIQGIEKVLADAGHNITFNEIYLDWITAIVLDETGFDDGLYGFENFDLQVDVTETLSTIPINNESQELRYYAPYIWEITDLQDNLWVEIEKPADYDYWVTPAVSIAFHDSEGWHVTQAVCASDNNNLTVEIVGDTIDELYVIATLILHSSPLGGSSVGLGYTADVFYSIREDTSTDTGLLIDVLALSIGISTVGIVLLVIVIFRKKRN
ncbi:MAG: hypothetical protein ACXADL_13230 [Candidatus Thorarchaeota archaeon]|jgi:hypothetical protein